MDVLNINIGHVGIDIGNHFWKQLFQQHNIKEQPVGLISNFFVQNEKTTHPRSLLINGSQKYPQPSYSKQPFDYKQQNVIISNKPQLSSYGQGKYNYDLQFMENIEDRIRKQIQFSDSLGGILMISQTSGGFQSSTTNNVLKYLRETKPNQMVQTFRLIPSLSHHCHPVEIYNTIFSLHHEVQYSNMSILLDNQAVTKMLTLQGNTQPSSFQMNQKIGSAIANSTIPYRFKGDLNSSIRKIATNMALYYRYHFMALAQNNPKDLNSIVSAFKPTNCFLSQFQQQVLSPNFFNIYAGIRSNTLSQTSTLQQINKQFLTRGHKLLNFMPAGFHLTLHEPIKDQQTTIFLHSQHMATVFKSIVDEFNKSWKRKAFLHHYTQAGIDQMQFQEASQNVNDVYLEYSQNFQYQGDGQEYLEMA